MRHKKREWEPSESHCPTPMASSSAYSCPLHGKGFSRTSNCPYPVLSEPILRHLISSSHPSTKSSVFSNFKTHLSMAILLPWGRKNVYIFLVVGRHSTEGSCHVQQFPTGSAGVVPLVQGSRRLLLLCVPDSAPVVFLCMLPCESRLNPWHKLLKGIFLQLFTRKEEVAVHSSLTLAHTYTGNTPSAYPVNDALFRPKFN